MALENTTTKVEGLGNGVANTFPFSPLRLFEPRAADGGTHDLEVTRVNADESEELLSEGTGTNNYSVTVASYPGTGSVVFPASGPTRLPTGAKLVIKRKVRLKQYENLSNNGPYAADTQEEMHDRHRMVDLQQQEEIDRAVKVPIGSSVDPADLIEQLSTDAATAASAATTATAAAATATAAAANLPNAPAGGANNFPRVNATADGWAYLNAAALLAAIGAEDAALNHGYLDVSQTWTAGQTPLTGALTDGATVNWNAANAQVATVTCAAARTFAAPTNLVNNRFYALAITNSGGAWAHAFNAAFIFDSNDGTPGSFPASSRLHLTFRSDGTNLREWGRRVVAS